MTREEAIAELSVLHERLSNPKDCEDGCYSWEDGWYVEAIDMAIEALSAEAVDCSEFIKWILDEIMDEENWEYNAVANGEVIARKLKKLGLLEVKDGYYVRTPSAEADMVRCKECEIKAYTEKLVDAFIEDGEELAESAEAVHGKWLVKEKEDADGYYWWRECSNCGRKPLLDRWNRNEVLSAFCPYCGAKMTKGGDDE